MVDIIVDIVYVLFDVGVGWWLSFVVVSCCSPSVWYVVCRLVLVVCVCCSRCRGWCEKVLGVLFVVVWWGC